MADFVDSLTDAELRTKLAEYGFPVVPITTTTRKVMAKKLKMLIENKNKVNTEGRKSLAKYSSEEESDEDVKSKKNRRMTTGMLPPSSKTRKSVKKLDEAENDNVSTSRTLITETKTRRTTRLVKPVVEAETGSDSEPEIVDEYINNESTTEISSDYKPSVSRPSYTSSYLSSRSPLGASTSGYNNSLSSTSTTTRYSTAAETSGISNESSADRLNQIRSRLSLGERKIGENIDQPSETPFLSNFSKRLSQLSNASAPKVDYNYKNDIIKEHDANGSSSYNRSYLSRARNRDYAQDFKSSQEKNIFRNNFVSFTLLGIVVVFFAAITVMYMGIRNEQTSISENPDYSIPLCENSEIGGKPGINCVLQDDVADALNLKKVLIAELAKRSVAHYCTDSSIKPYMNDDQIIEFVSTNYALKDPYEIQKGIHNLQVLIFRNPKWGLSVIKIDQFHADSTALDSLEKIFSDRPKRNLALISTNPVLPWKCGFFVVYSSHKAYKYFLNEKKIRAQKVYTMVEKIIDILQSNASESSENFLAVNHVRDMLIAPQDRKKNAAIWKEAVKFLMENESRMRTEVQIVAGEEFQVWRWLGANLNSSSPKSKSWQGQAFETQVGAVNSLPCSPTPCLKIRGMFDERERNFYTVREAVLGKCASKCQILHCEIDTNSGCVYLKCANQAEAAIAYQNLHGWWFDGHLVTVKYLRLERYMQRFPDSPTRGPPFLSPTSNQQENWTTNDD